MNARIERVKQHFRENKKVYFGTGCGIVAGAVVVLVTSSRSTALGEIVQYGFRNEANKTIIHLVERSTPSKPVHLVGTNLYFSSLSEAARETGHQLSMISQNVNGHIPDVKGDVFEQLEFAA